MCGNKNVQRLKEHTNNQGMVATSGKVRVENKKQLTQPQGHSSKGTTAMMIKDCSKAKRKEHYKWHIKSKNWISLIWIKGLRGHNFTAAREKKKQNVIKGQVITNSNQLQDYRSKGQKQWVNNVKTQRIQRLATDVGSNWQAIQERPNKTTTAHQTI